MMVNFMHFARIGSVDEDMHPVCRAGGDHVVVNLDGGLGRVDGELESLDKERDHNPGLEQRQVLAQAVPGPIDERVKVVDVKRLLEPLRPGLLRARQSGAPPYSIKMDRPDQQTRRARGGGKQGGKEEEGGGGSIANARLKGPPT